MGKWKTYSSRITLFPKIQKSSALQSALELYRKIWSVEPDSFQKPDNALKPMIAQGKRSGLLVRCSAQPVRIDFHLEAAPSQKTQNTINLIDDAGNFLHELNNIISVIGEGLVSNPIDRVAVFLHFLNPMPNYEEANETLTKVIPSKYGVNVTNEEEFVFNINQPKMSMKLQDIKMNFVTKWSVDQIQFFSFPIPQGGIALQAGMASLTSQSETFIVASVSFDNNNIPERVLSVEEQRILLQEALESAIKKQQEIGLNIGGF
jgi:hypothetical protein